MLKEDNKIMLADEDLDMDLDLEDAASDEGDAALYEHFKLTVDPGQSLLRIDRFLVDKLPNASRTKVQEAADKGALVVNGKSVKSNYKVKPNDVITIYLDHPKRDTEIIAEDIPLDIVYEDEDVVVVNKVAGMVVHPGCANYSGTLLNALKFHFQNDSSFKVTDARLGLVHRIDKDTSGLLVIAKNDEACMHLSKQFFNKTTSRLYQALVWGVPNEMSGTVDTYIGRNDKDRLQMAVYTPDREGGKHAVTHYKVLEQFRYTSLVECALETGRTHQIRVHMKHLGHPLFSDARYGGDKILKGTTFAMYQNFVKKCMTICPRQALHAKTLGFDHPRTGERLFFSSPIASDMQEVIDLWRNYCQQN